MCCSSTMLEGIDGIVDHEAREARLARLVDDVKRGFVEVGDQASWSLSSAKPGFGVAQLRDDNTSTYWQSDDNPPHTISIQFPRLTLVEEVHVYFSFASDESYTPAQVEFREGPCLEDVDDLCSFDLDKPEGWIPFSVRKSGGPDGKEIPRECGLLQFRVTANHQSGRDCHIRQIRVYGPRGLGKDTIMYGDTVEFGQWSSIR